MDFPINEFNCFTNKPETYLLILDSIWTGVYEHFYQENRFSHRIKLYQVLIDFAMLLQH